MTSTSEPRPDGPEHDRFPTDPAGVPDSVATEEIALAEGDSYELRIGPVAKRLGDSVVRMLAYNGSIPGPCLRVGQGARVAVKVVNEGDLEATVHWHGLRLENRYDGTHQTQAAIPVGGSFTAQVDFPDPGLYWYHPHVRQDYGQELGLYGTIVVQPTDPNYWPPVDREFVLTLDDILLEHGRVAPFDRSHTTHTAMGRFGDVFLISGETDLELGVDAGEVVRLYLVNTANTRVFNVTAADARMKLVGGDSGRYEREEFVDAVLLAPSERIVVDVLCADPGTVTLHHRTPDRSYPLARINVSDKRVPASAARDFETLRVNDDLAAERDRITALLEVVPDKTLAFVAEMELGGDPAGAGGYTCPMHLEVTQDAPGRCPHCGMKLLPTSMVSAVPEGTDHSGPPHHDDHAGHGENGGHGDHGGDTRGIEWEDDMVEVNRRSTPDTMRWLIIDRATGARNHEIDWRFQVGDQVKIRLINQLDSDHPMHHPFHIHGAGRFLVISRDGALEPNLVWKDTVLVRTGETVDLLLDVTNPGRWMAHCHIAEHHEGGMMFDFRVDPAPTAAEPAR